MIIIWTKSVNEVMSYMYKSSTRQRGSVLQEILEVVDLRVLLLSVRLRLAMLFISHSVKISDYFNSTVLFMFVTNRWPALSFDNGADVCIKARILQLL